MENSDGDFVTADTLWDFKVSVNPPTKNHTLQLLVYWLMARRSEWNWRATWNWDHKTPEGDWRDNWDLDAYLRKNRAWPDDLQCPIPTHLGVYNPRLNAAHRLAVDSIPAEVITAVERDVIGY